MIQTDVFIHLFELAACAWGVNKMSLANLDFLDLYIVNVGLKQ